MSDTKEIGGRDERDTPPETLVAEASLYLGQCSLCAARVAAETRFDAHVCGGAIRWSLPAEEAARSEDTGAVAASAGTSPATPTLRELLSEAADELEAVYREQYSDGNGGIHPTYQRKFDRDMALVRQLREPVPQCSGRGPCPDEDVSVQQAMAARDDYNAVGASWSECREQSVGRMREVLNMVVRRRRSVERSDTAPAVASRGLPQDVPTREELLRAIAESESAFAAMEQARRDSLCVGDDPYPKARVDFLNSHDRLRDAIDRLYAALAAKEGA